MAIEVNFLPEDLKPKGYAIKLSKKLRRVALICLSVFFISAVLYFGSSLLFSFEIKRYTSDEDKTKNQINALNSTEQSLVLAQDRLEKIAAVLAASNAQDEVETAQKILAKDLQGISIKEFNLDKSEAVISFYAEDSHTLTRFFYQLLNSNFKNIRVLSFNYDYEKGYFVEISISS